MNTARVPGGQHLLACVDLSGMFTPTSNHIPDEGALGEEKRKGRVLSASLTSPLSFIFHSLLIVASSQVMHQSPPQTMSLVLWEAFAKICLSGKAKQSRYGETWKRRVNKTNKTMPLPTRQRQPKPTPEAGPSIIFNALCFIAFFFNMV